MDLIRTPAAKGRRPFPAAAALWALRIFGTAAIPAAAQEIGSVPSGVPSAAEASPSVESEAAFEASGALRSELYSSAVTGPAKATHTISRLGLRRL